MTKEVDVECRRKWIKIIGRVPNKFIECCPYDALVKAYNKFIYKWDKEKRERILKQTRKEEK